MTTMAESYIHQIEGLIKQDPGGRLFTSVVQCSHLLASSSKLLQDSRILIVTGFCILDTMTGETDGPPGALVLGNALSALGKEVAYVTDQYSYKILQQGMQHYPLTVGSPIFTITKANSHEEITTMLNEVKPDHIVSIERPGVAMDGKTYSMRGERLDHVIPQLDIMFDTSSEQVYTTTAIGDGGNEMGLGSFHDKIAASVPMGQLIATITPADYVIPAGISNWGGYAVAGVLSILSGRSLLPAAGTEKEVVNTMVDAGAVDGCIKQRVVSVDGIDFDLYLDVIQQIYQVVNNALTDLTKEV